jgi:hypothetical protein
LGFQFLCQIHSENGIFGYRVTSLPLYRFLMDSHCLVIVNVFIIITNRFPSKKGTFTRFFFQTWMRICPKLCPPLFRRRQKHCQFEAIVDKNSINYINIEHPILTQIFPEKSLKSFMMRSRLSLNFSFWGTFYIWLLCKF